MDLIARLRGAAFRRPRLLVVAEPSAVATRLAVERYAREHGWPSADSAADADVLAVIGRADGELASVVGVLARQIPAPWVRVDLGAPEEVASQLDTVPEQLGAWSSSKQDGHRAAAGHGDQGPASDPGDLPAEHEMAEHGGHDMAAHPGHQMVAPAEHHMPADDDQYGADHGMAEHRAGDMGGHGGSDMGGHAGDDMGGHGHVGHDMGPVAGLPMAGRAPDRDGLKLDVLQVPLGPVLPFWPAGLRLALVVQGDVVQEARVEPLVLGQDGHPFWDEPVLRVLAGESVSIGEVSRRRAASHLDSLMRLLGVAGWEVAAVRCASLRDRALAGEPAAVLSADFSGLQRMVSRSRTLRAMISGLGVLDGPAADRYGVSGPAATAAGDVVDRLGQWIRATGDDLNRMEDPSPAMTVEGPRGRLDRDEPPSSALLAALPSLVVGAELASARLIVASLDPDISELPLVREVAARG